MASWDEEEDALVVLERGNYRVIKRSSGEIIVFDGFQGQKIERYPTELERYLIEELVERIHANWEW